MDTPFTTIGDEPVEARIVAWVLGEASAFEAAELERLCAERPELMIFKRRMLALHGLLAEAENPLADESWKLQPEKRRAVEEILGEEQTIRLNMVKEKRIRHSGRRAFLAIAACVLFTLVITQLLPWKQTSEAIIEVKPRIAGMSPLGAQMTESSGAGRMTPQFFGTEFEKIKSRNSLEKVVDNLDLTDRWGMDKEQAVEKLKDSIKTENVRGTDLIKIQVRNPDKKDADEIAREVAYAYKDYREQIEKQDVDRQLAELNKAVRDQEDKVEERRKVLATIVRNKGIIYKGNDSSYGSNDTDESAIKRGLDAQDYVDAKREFETDQQLLQTMKLKQVGETIARKAPSESVVLHEVPGSGAKSTERASDALASYAPARTQRLETTLPKELIEGTPRPINVPNLEVPADSPAGSDSWSVNEESQLAYKPRVRPEPPARPSAPASSVAKVIAASTAAATAVPMPEVDVTAPSLDFGSADDFGTGWGGGNNQEEGRLAGGVGGAKIELQSGLRSRDGAVIQNNIDAIPNQPGRPAEAAAAGEKSNDSWDTSKAVAKGKAGTEYELHTGYKNEYLFRGVDLGKDHDASQKSSDQEISITEADGTVKKLAVPRITTRSALAPDKAIEGAQQLRKEGKYDEAKKILEDTLTENPANQGVRDEIAKLDDPIRTNPALTYEHTQKADGVRRGLDQAEGNFNLGKFDDARREYEDVLRKDSSNQAARKGMERIAAAKSDYYRAAYDHTRAELLAEVDKAWEKSDSPVEIEGFTNFGAPIADRDAQLPARRGIIVDREFQYPTEFEPPALPTAGEGSNIRSIESKSNSQPPKPDLAKLMEEIATSEEPYSTFSLNISDASFRIAQAAMDRGERPDPAGVKVEQFYNAVDYGDPAPAAGEPVSCEIERAAHPVIPGRNLVRVALKTAAAGRSATQPLHLTLLVDQSGSMTRADRRAAMDAAMASLGKLLTDKDLVNIVGFSRTSRLVADGMKGDEAGKKLAALVNQSASEGGTNLETAIDLAAQMAQRRMLAGAQNRIVLFTDGAANLGDADPQRLAAKVERLRQQGVAFDIAGIAAEGLNDELLGELARKGNGRYYVVGKDAEEDFAKQLAGAFRPAAENVKVQVRFNPERVTRYKLIGFEKDRLKTEDFRNDKVDAAELAAEEAGVAIYQIEPNPNGTGEIGEVSVRFRDTASGEMVERGWTIPHDAAAPAIDRATPSMQLATLAMLTAEKLKGGPLGDAIDFKQLAEAQANVKRFFGSNARVAEMLRMVEMLK